MSSDNANKLKSDYVFELITFYALSMSINDFNDEKQRISFTDSLEMNNIKYIVYDYSYNGNEELTKVAIPFKKDIIKIRVKKTHKDNTIKWNIKDKE